MFVCSLHSALPSVVGVQMSEVDDIKSALKGEVEVEGEGQQYLSTGSTLLNLAISGRVDGGYPCGRYTFFVGDSKSGKTWLGLTAMAEACLDKRFDGYRLIYDDVEGGALMDRRRYFGAKAEQRVEPPSCGDDGNPVYSSSVEEFYFHLDDAVKDGRPFVYVLDSQDALTSAAESGKFDEQKEAHRKGKTVAGSYGDSKAKVHSSNIRKFLKPLRESNSLLLILNQTRDSFDLFEKSTYSGGRALLFYASVQLWSSVGGKVERTVKKGKKRELGVRCKVKVKKNRVTGRDRVVVVPILHSVGIDDLGSCVDYMVEEGAWEKTGQGRVKVTGLGDEFVDTRERTIGRIEEEWMEADLRRLVAKAWERAERESQVKRKRRYK